MQVTPMPLIWPTLACNYLLIKRGLLIITCAKRDLNATIARTFANVITNCIILACLESLLVIFWRQQLFVGIIQKKSGKNMTHKNIKYQASALAIALCLGSTLIGEAALAQSATGADEVVIVTGSRRARSAANSASPIDVVGRSELSRSADSDVAALVRNSVPSFNVNTQSINDAASVVRPANLRGMAPDHTLVLVNGKRRHRASVIAFIGGGIANGSQGADISVFPAIALKQVEVLRDGAAAQYGSDAIAGVMNFILRTDSDSLDINGKWGQTYEGDGASYTVSANLGVPLGENGFANLSIEYGNQDATSRSIQRADAAALLAAGNTAIRTPAVQVWGQPDIMDELKIWLNTGFP
ncbi:MAG: hypothetical protein FD128_2313 [Hyphomonadaceae bacterium]|nr:MAG: hypothetical protein FD128_2313 [Hyphomonadaceae bacterium]